MNLDRDKILHALRDVHLSEHSLTNPAGVTRDVAVTNAITAHSLNNEEESILRSATHTKKKEK